MSAYSLTLVVAGHTAGLAVILGGAVDPAMKVYSSTDVLLATFGIDPALSEVDAGTGAIVLAIGEQEDSAPATGTASYAEIIDGDGAVHLRMDCAEGSVAVPGVCVLSSLAIVQGAPAEAISIGLAAPTLIGA
jgi:hypothetical protein